MDDAFIFCSLLLSFFHLFIMITLYDFIIKKNLLHYQERFFSHVYLNFNTKILHDFIKPVRPCIVIEYLFKYFLSEIWNTLFMESVEYKKKKKKRKIGKYDDIDKIKPNIPKLPWKVWNI